MNSEELFRKFLDLSDQWAIKDVRFDPVEKRGVYS